MLDGDSGGLLAVENPGRDDQDVWDLLRADRASLAS
jgi:hypothetical protein